MPSEYLYECGECGWSDYRYRNLRFCPRCRAPVVRIGDEVLCYHGTNGEKAESIKVSGFRADTWFARHMEDAYKFGGAFIFGVMFDRKKIPPKSWQFHIRESISPDWISKQYFVEERDGNSKGKRGASIL